MAQIKLKSVVSQTLGLFIGLSVVATPVQAEDGARFPGPVELRNQYPLSLQQPTLRPKRAEVLLPKVGRLNVMTAWTNTSIKEDNYSVDAESVTLDAQLKYGLGSGLELSAVLPFVTRGGGTLDKFIDSWHRVLGFPRGDRRILDDDQNDVLGFEEDGYFEAFDSGSGMGSPELSVNYCPEGQGNYKICGNFSLGLPAPSVGYGQQALAASPGIIISRDFEAWSFSAGGSVWFYADRSIDGQSYRPAVPTGFIVVEHLLRPSWQIYAALIGGMSASEEILGHPDSEIYLDLGTRIKLNSSLSWDLVIRENPYPGDGTTDVSLVMGLGLDW